MVKALSFIHRPNRVARKASDVAAADWRYQTHIKNIASFHVCFRLFQGLKILYFINKYLKWLYSRYTGVLLFCYIYHLIDIACFISQFANSECYLHYNTVRASGLTKNSHRNTAKNNIDVYHLFV